MPRTGTEAKNRQINYLMQELPCIRTTLHKNYLAKELLCMIVTLHNNYLTNELLHSETSPKIVQKLSEIVRKLSETYQKIVRK